MKFYLGGDVQALAWGVPAMVSHGRLSRILARPRSSLPRASAPWICDSRGFSELRQHGRWTISPAHYASALERYAEEIGLLDWASPQDMMCEDEIIAKTGLDVLEHQYRTIESTCYLRERLAGTVAVIAVVQGKRLDEYHRCVDLYLEHGMDLRLEPVVGLGSVCRRESTAEVLEIVDSLTDRGLRLHGFGVKTDGLVRYGPRLASADSFAWSYGARRRLGLCPHGRVKWETNCPIWALAWREGILAGLERAELRPRQRSLAEFDWALAAT